MRELARVRKERYAEAVAKEKAAAVNAGEKVSYTGPNPSPHPHPHPHPDPHPNPHPDPHPSPRSHQV